MPKLQEKQSGRLIEVAPEDIQSLYSTGFYNIPEGETIAVVHPELGKRDYALSDYLMPRGEEYNARAFTSGEGEQELDAQRFKQEYGGLGNKILTAGEGALSSLTFGASDAIARGLGYDEAINRAEVNPGYRLGGEIAGMILPAIATAGASAPASAGKIAGQTVGRRILAGAGSAIRSTPAGMLMGATERAVASQAGKGLGTRVLAGAGLYGAEGAVFGLGEAVRDLSMDDKPLTAERILSTVSSKTLLGAAVGGGIGGALPLAGAGMSKLWNKGKQIVAKSQPISLTTKEITQIGDDMLLRTVKLDTEYGQLLNYADDVKRHYSSVGDDMDELVNEAGQQLLHRLRPTFEKAQESRNALSARLRSLMGITDESVDPLRASPLGKNRAKSVGLFKTMDEIEQITSLSMTYYDDLLTMRRAADELFDVVTIEKNVPARVAIPNISPEHRKTLEQISVIKRLMDEAAEVETKGYANFSSLVGAMALLSDVDAAKQIPYVGPLFGGITSAVYDIPILGPVLKLASYYAGVKSVFRLRGAKRVLKPKLQGNAEDAINEVIRQSQTRKGKALSAFFEAGTKAADAATNARGAIAPLAVLSAARFSADRGKKPETAADAYRMRAQELRELANNPDGVRSALTKHLTPFTEELRSELVASQVRRIEFLASKLPAEQASLLGAPKKPSAAEVSKFARYVRAVEDPHSVMEDLAALRLTKEAAEALRTVYPNDHAALTENILSRLPAKKLSYRAKQQLSIFFGAPLEYSHSPEFRAAMQALRAGSEQAAEAATPKRITNLSDGSQLSTSFDAAVARLTR